MNLLKQTKIFWNKNGSTVLSIVGAVGVVATTIAAVKATPKALKLIEEKKEEKGDELTKWETVRVALPTYVPSIILGTATISSIVGANLMSQRRQASIISAYALLNQNYKNYKRKVTDIYGEDANSKISTELAKENYDKDQDTDADDGKVLYYDDYSSRYYRMTSEEMLEAQYKINKILVNDFCATVNEYYDILGLEPIPGGDELGWSSSQLHDMYWNGWLEFYHEEITLDDGLECTIVHITEPEQEFLDY